MSGAFAAWALVILMTGPGILLRLLLASLCGLVALILWARARWTLLHYEVAHMAERAKERWESKSTACPKCKVPEDQHVAIGPMPCCGEFVCFDPSLNQEPKNCPECGKPLFGEDWD